MNHSGFEDKARLVNQFMYALTSGNSESLLELITEDAVLIVDGGGKVFTLIRPIYSKKLVLVILNALALTIFLGSKAQSVKINGQQGILITKEDIPIGVISFDREPQTTMVQGIFIIVNPDKLKHIDLNKFS